VLWLPTRGGGRRISQLEGCRIAVEMAKAVFRFSWRILDLGGGAETVLPDRYLRQHEDPEEKSDAPAMSPLASNMVGSETRASLSGQACHGIASAHAMCPSKPSDLAVAR
jgi:hypothetical protein